MRRVTMVHPRRRPIPVSEMYEKVVAERLPAYGGPIDGDSLTGEPPRVLIGSNYSSFSGLSFMHRYGWCENWCWSHMGVLMVSNQPPIRPDARDE